jgi:predicted  nucleic acid-binding Zn-ribbon protein
LANQLRQLYDLQQIELDIEQKQGRLGQIQVQLGDRETVAQAEASLEQERQNLARLNPEQRAAEWQVEDVATKAKTIEDKLYSGQVRNPKELLGMQKDLETVKAKQRQLEDKVLDIMSQVEESASRMASRDRELAREMHLWQESQGRLKAEQSELELALADLEERRSRLRSQINSAHLSLYDRLRPDKLGQAVARVEQGRCLGCRISLPMSIVQRVRLGEEIVQCPSCNRILV